MRWHSYSIRRGVLSMSFLTILAGFPATIQFAGTFLVTTEFAATIELSPIVTPLQILEYSPIQTFLPI